MGDPDPADGERGRLSRAAAKVVGFFDSVGKIVGTVAGVLALAGGLGLVTLGGGDEGEEKKEPTAVRFATDELAPVTNERFAFSFSHPTTWERQDAFNTDGSVFRSPDESVELRAFGVNASDGPMDVLARVQYLSARLQRSILDEAGQVLNNDLRFVAWEGPNDDQTPAERVVYRARDADTGRPITGVLMLTTQEGRDVTISCEVSRGRFAEFEGACNQLIGSLKLGRY